MAANQHEVVILGAGLASLSLARHLLIHTKKRVLLLEKRVEVPSARQKVGEATVQVSSYYFSKILDLEEHFFQEHLLKYNLRFYWPTPGRGNSAYEDYSQSYIRDLSNIATFQVDRNALERELLRLNLESDRFEFRPGIANLEVMVGESGKLHAINYEMKGERFDCQAVWLVDATGRARFLARKLGLTKPSPIRHGATFFWVNGLIDIEKLTGLSRMQSLIHPDRQKLGHLPAWLATNHFMGEGYWFWTIPLKGKTSLGLVYDHAKIHVDEVSSPEKVIAWIAKRFPMFAADLSARQIIDHGLYRDFSYDCTQSISADRWALAGESGRFSDPLYSPGGDLIALYNTLIVDAILTEEQSSLAVKARLYELLMWAFYEAYIPSYSESYDVLGDQECFAMKYGWELTVYFIFYVFPFINRVFTSAAFVVPFLDLFAKLGSINNSLQPFISGYYRWKKERPSPQKEPVFFDFTAFEPLRKAQELFYQVGLTPRECARTIERQMANVEKMARFIAAYIYSVVLEDDDILVAKNLAETIDIEKLEFNPEKMRQMGQAATISKESKLTKAGTDFITAFRRSKEQTS